MNKNEYLKKGPNGRAKWLILLLNLLKYTYVIESSFDGRIHPRSIYIYMGIFIIYWLQPQVKQTYYFSRILNDSVILKWVI